MVFKKSRGTQFKPRKRGQKRAKLPISGHPLFVLAFALWGVALGGLSVMVLPASLIDQIASASGLSVLGVLGDYARLVFAGFGAIFGAACMSLIGIAVRRRFSIRTTSHEAHDESEEVFPIDPSVDLVEESFDDIPDYNLAEEEAFEEDVFEEDFSTDISEAWLDDPLETEPEADAQPVERTLLVSPTAKNRDRRKMNRRKTDSEVQVVQALSPHLARKAEESKARAAQLLDNNDVEDLDLGAFSQIDDQDDSEPVAPVATREEAGPRDSDELQSAATKLRAVPPQELSLVEMVERFALALHERRAVAQEGFKDGLFVERDSELADALRTLAKYTERGFEAGDSRANTSVAQDGSDGGKNGTEREMRDALSSFQGLKGAA